MPKNDMFCTPYKCIKIFMFPGLTTANMLLVLEKEMHLNQCLLFAAGFFLTFGLGMFIFCFKSIIISLCLTILNDFIICFDMKHSDKAISVTKTIGLIDYYTNDYVELNVQCHKIITKKFKFRQLIESNI